MAKSKSELMLLLQQYGFYAVEINLYLDNFPENRKALRDYQKVTEIYQNLKKEYEMQYGTLANFAYGEVCGDWNYVNDPWPWEGKC